MMCFKKKCRGENLFFRPHEIFEKINLIYILKSES